MATQSILQLDIQRPEPLVWISRLLIVDSTEPLEVVQSISLHRGLNVVWSTDTDRGDGEVPVMTGHGAGKTTFCRLLRYCLGEPSFGQKLLVQRIRSEFPKGMVGWKSTCGVSCGLWLAHWAGRIIPMRNGTPRLSNSSRTGHRRKHTTSSSGI